MRTPHAELTAEQIGKALVPYGFVPTSMQSQQISNYISLLLQWNKKLSLTTVTDPVEIVGRHFGESAFLLKLAPVENCRLVDIGTGAGFPGVALKIACPSLKLVLVEANKKKAAFLSEVVRTLEIPAVEIWSERFEDIRPEAIEANVITSRAVGNYRDILQWAGLGLAARGHLALWIGAEEVTRVSTSRAWLWQPAAKIPESQRRFILLGRPVEKSAENDGD